MSPPLRIDFTLTDELKKLGITKMYCIGKLLELFNDGNEFRCKLDWNDLTKTTEKYLSTALAKKGFTEKDNKIICLKVMDLLVASVNLQIDKANQEEEQKQQEKNHLHAS